MASVMLDVARMRTFGLARSASSCVSSAFTTRTESLGSAPAMAACRAPDRDSTSSMSTITSESSSATRSLMWSKSLPTSFPDSENQRENSEWLLTSSTAAHGYLPAIRSASLWASALHSVVLPVPGGPCKRMSRLSDTSVGSTPASEKSTDVAAYRSSFRLITGSRTRLSHNPSNSAAGSCQCCAATTASSPSPTSSTAGPSSESW
mmetsp:Transcript_1515/g.5972  ORF Transcript_1515/g.5972 Transcript_1515/m.5972 type:complete len:206 (-) Transcript_1515:277-894(-)